MHTFSSSLAVDSAAAEIARREVLPLPPGVVVRRLDACPDRAPCGLCWVGPGTVAGLVRPRSAAESPPVPICSRCLVTLELLAAQFGTDLRLQLESQS